MAISGLALGFLKGWSMALAMLGIAPLMFGGMSVFAYSLKKRLGVILRAYGQSGGYADQCLRSIRVVVAFGTEKTEIRNYSRFLDRVRSEGSKVDIISGISLGFFVASIYLCYCYAFFLGSIWVDQGFWNHAADRPYSSGDCIAVLFGVLFGLFALSAVGPNFGAIAEGKAAGNLAFRVIDRAPVINQDSKTGIAHTLKGQIRFEGVDFYYPSRQDQKVLSNFTCNFEVGKTTAIVGSSGSGKSTIVQLIERFYEPTKGEIFVDEKALNKVKLRELRQQIGYVSQEPILFNTSIKKNILMGKPDATDDEIINALKKTNAWDFVSSAGGIEVNVGAGGN